MQGQRANNINHGSSSSGNVVEQHVCWNNMQNPGENTNILCLNSLSPEHHNLGGWGLDEPSSNRNTQNEVSRDEQKAECSWSSSSSSCVVAIPMSEDRRDVATDIFSVGNDTVNLLSQPSSSSCSTLQNLNLNASIVGHGTDDCQVMEFPNSNQSNEPEHDHHDCQVMGFPNLYQPNEPEHYHIPPPRDLDPFLLPPGSVGCSVEENESRPASMDGRRASRKRKALEGNIGQSSLSGSSNYFQRAENSAEPVVPWYTRGSSSTSAPSEQLNPRLGFEVRGLAIDSHLDASVSGNTERLNRNLRMRMSPSNNQNSTPSNLFLTGDTLRHPTVSSFEQSSRFPPVGQTLDFRTPPVTNSILQNQPALVHVSALRQNEQLFRWGEGSSSRNGSSSSSLIPRDLSRESARSRSSRRNNLEHPMFVPTPPGLRNLARNPAISPATNVNVLGDVSSGSASQTVHSLSAPTLVPQRNPSRYSHRLSDYVRRSLFSSSGLELRGQNNNFSPLHSVPTVSMQEMERTSRAGNQGHHQSYTRSSLTERQGDGVVGYPYSVRTAGEGRRTLVSEIQTVLDLMRRGDGLRFEDVMILDQSIFFGRGDIHDRHRDMRLDVDNMSYEELLALEERIGNVCTGLSEERILDHLKQRKYSIAVGDQTGVQPCCICQEEYNDGEDLGMLGCGHDFHIDCIKKWLMNKNLCPICKTEGLTE